MALPVAKKLVGQPAPDFPLTVLKAEGTSGSSTLRKVTSNGLPTVLDFFTTWCQACPAAAKKIEDLAVAHAGRCNFILVCLEGEDGVLDFAKAHSLNHCLLTAVQDEDLPDEYGIKGLPHHVLLDAQGTVVRNYEMSLPGDLELILTSSAKKAQEVASSAGYAGTSPPQADSAIRVGGGKASRISAQYKALEESEPILMENPDRWVMFPIKHPEVWEMYKKQEASFWTAEEIDLSQDMRDWEKLNEQEQHFIKHVLAFFAASDGIVLENLAGKFSCEVQIPEARAFYGFQIAMENIHSETYSLLIEQYIRDSAEKESLLKGIHTLPAVRAKAGWALQWMNDTNCFAERVVAFAAVEGILFSGSFCAIYWLKKRGLMPGLTFSNELISRDEGLHADFACLLYSMLENKLPDDIVHSMIRGAVEVERQFICESLSCDLIGMNSTMMTKYIEFVADRLLQVLGHPKIFNASNPFDWMELISLQGKTNFFEKRVGEYQKAGVMTGGERDDGASAFALDADF